MSRFSVVRSPSSARSRRRGRVRAACLSVFMLGAACATIAFAQGAFTLSINGRTVSTSARRINGVVYVPVNDVARAMQMRAFVQGNRISIRASGGAQQVANRLVGKVGDTLQTGRYQFTVLSVERAPHYEPQFRSRSNYEGAQDAGEGQELIVVKCRIKNLRQERLSLAFPTYPDTNTSLTDFDEQTYTAIRHDVYADGSAPLVRSMLPGSATPFNIVFRVPQGTRLKDLIYTAGQYAHTETQTDFRVHLNNG